MSDTEVEDGLDELEERDLIIAPGAMRADVMAKAAAWLYMDEETLGYDLWEDMFAVAERAVEHETVEPETLETETGLPQQRVNIAALALEHQDLVKLVRHLGTGEYDFSEAQATRHTRQWVRENQS